MKTYTIHTAIFIILSSLLTASPNSSFEFLKTNFGARANAMGGAFTGSQQDLMALMYNPAGLLGIKDRKAAFSYLDYFIDLKGGLTVYGQPLSNEQAVAFSMAFMSYGAIDKTDITGQSMGSFTPGDFLISAAYAGQSRLDIQYGIAAKFIQSQIDHFQSNALAFDAGLLYRIETQQMDVGIRISNAGLALSAYHEEKENLPTAYHVGVSKSLAHLPLTIQFQLTRYQFQESDLFGGLYWALGGEFQLGGVSFLRWGYNSIGNEQKADSDIDRFTGVSFGFGTQVNRFIIDYAFSYHGVLGSTSQFTVQITF